MHKLAWMVVAALGLPALAQQGPNDIEALTSYAGTWAVDCAKPEGTRLTVSVQSLSLVAGGKQLQVGSPMAAFSYLGQSPPADFDVALFGDSGMTRLAFLAMKDKTGRYLVVETDTPMEQQFDKAALAGKFRRCP